MQEDYIYNNVIKYNIDLGKNYTEKEIEKSLEYSSLLETIKSFPKKCETYIGEDGIKNIRWSKTKTYFIKKCY